MRRAIFAAVLLAASSAHADDADDRIVVATVHGGFAIGGPTAPAIGAGAPDTIDGLGDLRGVVSFEHAPLPYREPRGYHWRGVMVPEILAGAIFSDGDRQAYVGGGLRLQADFSQRRMGLLQVSARGDFYLAGRAGLLTDRDHTPFGEGAFGEAFWIGGTRIGFEGVVREIFAPEAATLQTPVAGTLARVPWDGGSGRYLTLGFAITLSTTM